MNVIGGKVLLPIEKYLATKERQPIEDEERKVYTNYAGSAYLMEAWYESYTDLLQRLC